MISLLLFLGLVLFVLVCGIAIGATIVRDWLDGLMWWRAPAPAPKKATIPLATVLSRAEQRRLEIPAVQRRTRIPAIRDEH